MMNPAARDQTDSKFAPPSPEQGQFLPPGAGPGLSEGVGAVASGPTTVWWQRAPVLPLMFTAAFFGFMLFPPVRDNPRLIWTFVAIGSTLLVWQLILWAVRRRSGRLFVIEYTPVKAHWVQACVQSSILLYWGLFWEQVYPELPLIISQVVFLYILDALLTWSRGRNWRLGFGPLPIIVSTNLLLWFKHDWYHWQFLMLTTGALAKQFITWEREGKRMHIFNPSAFGQFVFAIVLIATGTTNDLTWGKQIAASFDPPYMLVMIFLGGLVVQFLFHVTLMTVAATAALIVANLIWTELTGTYYFVTINIAGPIFLGVHLLITDPATSPRTNLGRVMFGILYGLGYFILFRVLDLNGVPTFWDKLLPVPILNLCVPMIDRLMRSGLIGRFNLKWETALAPRALNLIHMTFWGAIFAAMWFANFIEAPHPGNSIPFWKKAFVEGRPFAGHSLVMAAGAQAVGGGSGAAFNELGLICMEGKITDERRDKAAFYFARACELNDESGCVNVAIQYLCLGEWLSEQDVNHALELLERDCLAGGNVRSCFLIGLAHETGRGRPRDWNRAIEFYERCGDQDLYAAKALARIALTGVDPPYDIRPFISTLAVAASQNDVESTWYLAYMYRNGVGLKQDLNKARSAIERACALGFADACEALKHPALPEYTDPIMMMPPWASAYPVSQ